MKTCLHNVDPLKPHFYIVKLGFTRVYIFLFLLRNISCGYVLEPPYRCGSDEYPQSMFWAEIWNCQNFYLKNFIFLVVKFSVYLNRHVSVMKSKNYPDTLSIRTGPIKKVEVEESIRHKQVKLRCWIWFYVMRRIYYTVLILKLAAAHQFSALLIKCIMKLDLSDEKITEVCLHTIKLAFFIEYLLNNLK